MALENIIETDVLVIGGSIAGCFAAIKAREQGLDVTIVDKGYAGKSGASIAAAEICSWLAFDEPQLSLGFNACMNAMTVACEYINNREWSEIVLKESWAAYEDLVAWASEVPLEATKLVHEWSPYKVFRLRRREWLPALRKQAEKVGVKILDRIMVTDLLKQEGKVIGAIGFPMESYDLNIFKAKATVVSCGGNSFKPPGWALSCLTGDAEAMAYRAGAEITGKEFPAPYGTGAIYPAWHLHRSSVTLLDTYTNGAGEKLQRSSSEGWWEPNLALDFLVHAGKGPVIWDRDAGTHDWLDGMHKLALERMGIDPSGGGKIPLAGGTAAGYADVQAAGIWVINTKCATSLPGLYTAGDCCGARLVGAYHPAPGFGVTGAAVTGKRAGGGGAAEYALQAEEPIIDKEELARLKKTIYAPTERKAGFSPRWVTQLLQNTMMPYYILHIKHGKRLQAALTIVEFLRDHLVPKMVAKDAHELRLAHETKNMVLNAEMILRASLFRTESRGVHYREDYPRRDDPAWLAWTKLKEEQGSMKLSKEPIPEEWWPDLSKPYEERYPVRFPGESVE